MTDNSERSLTPPASKDRSLGPAPLPTFHGKGCICKQYPRNDCPALQTPEGQERERARELNSARCRLREAEIRWSEAGEEVARLRAVLGELAATLHERGDADREAEMAARALNGEPTSARETTPAPTSNKLTESLCHEGEKDWQIDQLLEYLHYDPETKSHPDWVARAQAAEAEVERLTRERQGWVDTAAEFARNMEYYQGLVDRIGRAIGREAYIADDGSVSQDVLRAKVPEIVERVLSERNQSPSETAGDGLSIDETRFLAALAGVKPPAGSPGGHTAYGRTLIERVWDEYMRLRTSEKADGTP